MKKEQTLTFVGIIEHFEGTFRNYALFIPPEILNKLPQKGRIRMEGTFNDFPFNLAIQSAKELGKYFMISNPTLKAMKLKPGMEIKVTCKIADPEKLDMPEEFLAALELDEDANTIFQAMTTGLKRSLLHYVNSAKSSETRIKRSLELLEKMKTGQLHVQKNK